MNDTEHQTSNHNRIFIGIGIPDAIRAPCEAVSDKLIERFAKDSIRLVKSENYHITLCFIGQVEEDSVSALVEPLTKICQQHQVFQIDLTEILPFPSTNPRVIVYDMIQSEALVKLAKDIKSAVSELGLNQNKKSFHGHLTLARIHNHNELSVSKDLSDSLSFDVTHVNIYESVTQENGPKYNLRHKIPLVSS